MFKSRMCSHTDFRDRKTRYLPVKVKYNLHTGITKKDRLRKTDRLGYRNEPYPTYSPNNKFYKKSNRPYKKTYCTPREKPAKILSRKYCMKKPNLGGKLNPS